MMKNLSIIFILTIIFSSSVSAQEVDPKLSSKYFEMNITGLSLVEYVDEYDFKPIKLVTDLRTFKALMLQMSDAFYKQVNISSWWMCSAKHDEYFKIYNLYYPNITKEHYEKYCKEINALMLMDGVVEQPK